MCCGTGVQWASPALEPLLPPTLRAGSLESKLFGKKIPKRSEQGGAGLGEQPCRGQGAAGGQGTHRESWGARGREQHAITWCGGQAQIRIRDPLFHPSLGLSLCVPQGKR